MPENQNRKYKELDKLIEERSQKILERFDQVAVLDVKDSKLLEILADLKNYWSSRKSSSRDFVRPVLTSFCCEAVGSDPEVADDAGLMFTLASSGFGIHDDILDKSLYKHLRSTILGLHGIDGALLVGDLLIVKAWTVIHRMIRKNYKPTKIAEIMMEYGKFSVEICEAEFMETRCRRNLETGLDYYLNILWQAMAETGACCKIGAIIGDGLLTEVEALEEFGRRLGFTYRLTDDIQDCLNLKGDLNHRIEYESVPLPLLYAAKSSPEKFKQIKKIIEKANIAPSDIKKLLGFCFETEAFEYVRGIAEKNVRQAEFSLSHLRRSKASKMLSLFNEGSYKRISELCI
jgi:geranylgeranyl pyrophosphate synthase